MSFNASGQIEIKIPGFAREEDKVEAFFTLKNGHQVNKKGNIPGLNVGYNTGETEKTVRQNRNRLFDYLELEPEWVAQGGQVHSSRVRLVTAGGLYPETDGLVTVIPGLTLAIQVADCAAVLLADKVHGVIAAVHAGWRGAIAGVVENALGIMNDQGAVASKTEAYISPCISKSHFEVGEEVAELFPESCVFDTGYDRPHVDLKKYLVYQLRDHGISESRIEVDPGCTYANSDQYYSYRREGEKSGRMFALVTLNN